MNMKKHKLALFPLMLGIVALSGLVLAQPDIHVGKGKEVIYEKPTFKELSRLYWSLGTLDINNDTYVDNFLLINECDIYKKYKNNEFEWDKIRDATRKSLKENVKYFSRHIEYVQPIFLGEYHVDEQYFDIVEDYQMELSRRLEILAAEKRTPICNIQGEIEGYPRGILVELTRPFELKKVPAKPDVAKEFIEKKLKEYKKTPEKYRNRRNFLESRDAYLWLKMRVFGFKDVKMMSEAYKLNTVFAVLHGIEVYGDRGRREKLYSKDFNYERPPSQFEKRLQKKYQASLRDSSDLNELASISEGKGLLYLAEEILAEKENKKADH